MLCDVHCRTVSNRCCRALCYRCNMVLATPGSGCIFSYFRETTMFADILQISHSLCLAHLPQGLHDPAVEQPLFNSIASTYRDVEGFRRLYLHQREQVGMFLKVRATCRFSLYYCSSWYQEIVRREVRKIVSFRLFHKQVLLLQEALGCVCKTCKVVWLRRGWICPACEGLS